MDRQAAKEAIAAFMRALGHPPTGDLADSPQLVADAWCDELLSGYGSDPAEVLRAGLVTNTSGQNLVVLRDVHVTTMCPHHLMPAYGTADIMFMPGDHLAGFGTITRALHAQTRRLALQEATGATFANILVEALGARGALCRLRMTHTCLVARGARETRTVIESLALAGSFERTGGDRSLALGALTR